MKKAYTKPELFCEDYELSTAIAGNCSAALHAAYTNQSNYTSCSYQIGFDFLFVKDNGECDTYINDGGSWAGDTICYQVPTAAEFAFSS